MKISTKGSRIGGLQLLILAALLAFSNSNDAQVEAMDSSQNNVVVLAADTIATPPTSLDKQAPVDLTGQLLDGIVGVIGDAIVLKSDIDIQQQQLKEQGVPANQTYCYVWQQMLFQKLLVHKAEVDSLEVTDKEVEFEMERRLTYLLGQMGGSEVEFQKYFGKTVLQFKEEMQPIIKDNLKGKRMQAKIAEGVQVSPSEVEAFYGAIPKDSLPIIPEQYKVAQILLTPTPSSYEKERIRKELEGIRQEILNGQDFGLMALLHSKDPGSRDKKGELGFVSRDQLVPSFAAAAFKLAPGEISEIVESAYGFHIIQLVEKKGTFINVRHILLTPQVYTSDVELTKVRMDSVLTELQKDGANFNKMATAISDDERTKENGGVLVNYQTGDDYFTADALEENLYFAVQKLKKGAVSAPEIIQLPGGKTAYRILLLMDKVEFHTANIKTDYEKIKASALEVKKQKEVDKWIEKKIANTYLRLPEECNTCSELKVWTSQANKAK